MYVAIPKPVELKFLFVNVCTYDLAYHFFLGGGVLMTENMLSMGQKKSFHSLFKKVLLFFLSGQCNEVYNFHPLVQVDLRMSEYKKKRATDVFPDISVQSSRFCRSTLHRRRNIPPRYAFFHKQFCT